MMNLARSTRAPRALTLLLSSLAIGALAACAEAPSSPSAQRPSLSQVVDLPAGCEHIAPPAGSKLVTRMYAEGVQIYRWTGSAWVGFAPRAVLYSNLETRDVIGTHYAGPHWESNSGSKVKGAVQQRCTPDASAVQWLLLGATSVGSGGIFANVTHIQRVNTVGGLAPSTPGSVVDELAETPYTTEYLFYRAP